MKNLLKITITLAVLLAVGCATAPEPEPAAEPAPQEKPAPPPEPAAETPNPAAESRATAQQLRSVVERNKFGDESPKNYAAAETAFESAEKVYDSAPEQANTLYTDAAANYRLVIDEGARIKAERARADVQAKREQARSVKAEVAQKQRYNQAEADLAQAESRLEQKQYEEAFTAFDTAGRGFSAAYTAARDQRQRALRSLEDLDQSLTNTADQLGQMQRDMEVEND